MATPFELQPNETAIDSWTIMYITPEGTTYNGKLWVTNQRLMYEAQFEMSAASMAMQAFLLTVGGSSYVQIPKSRIKNVEVKKSFFSKKVILTLDDSSVHTFNYGMMNIDKCAAAIQQQ